MMKKVYPHLYRFAWSNKEIPQGALVRLVAVGKLQSCEVEVMNEARKHYVTDRRALRIVELNHWKDFDVKDIVEQKQECEHDWTQLLGPINENDIVKSYAFLCLQCSSYWTESRDDWT